MGTRPPRQTLAPSSPAACPRRPRRSASSTTRTSATQAPGASGASAAPRLLGSSPGRGERHLRFGRQRRHSFPGNVFQTSAGANSALFGGNSPQTFTSQGTGLTLQDHYVGGRNNSPIKSNGSTYYYDWSSGMLNTEGKRFFPSGGATEFYRR